MLHRVEAEGLALHDPGGGPWTEMVDCWVVVLDGEREGGTLPVYDDPVTQAEVEQDGGQAGGLDGRDGHLIQIVNLCRLDTRDWTYPGW